MSRRSVLTLIFAVTVAVVAGYGLGHQDRSGSVDAAQPAATWNSATLWFPSLAETGDGLAGLLNQIDGSCSVDADTVLPTNGATSEGTVYAVSVTWACPATDASASGATWNSSTLWYPTLAETGDALAELTNQIDASCVLDVDRLVAANGAGPEGPVYAFIVTWACPGAV